MLKRIASAVYIKSILAFLAFTWKLHLTVSCREQNKLEKSICSSTQYSSSSVFGTLCAEGNHVY